jgi:hypothetical protein
MCVNLRAKLCLPGPHGDEVAVLLPPDEVGLKNPVYGMEAP